MPPADPRDGPSSSVDAPSATRGKGAKRTIAALAAAIAVIVVVATAGATKKPQLTGATPVPTVPLEPGAVAASVSFSNGRGNCPASQLSFTRSFQLSRAGDSARLYEPSAHDIVQGTVTADGSFVFGNAYERYRGAFSGRLATGTYRVVDPRTHCPETYDFALEVAGR